MNARQQVIRGGCKLVPDRVGTEGGGQYSRYRRCNDLNVGRNLRYRAVGDIARRSSTGFMARRAVVLGAARHIHRSAFSERSADKH